MENTKTNYKQYHDQLLSNEEVKSQYDTVREKIKIEMMLETLKEQVLHDGGRKAILSQITKINNAFARITF